MTNISGWGNNTNYPIQSESEIMKVLDKEMDQLTSGGFPFLNYPNNSVIDPETQMIFDQIDTMLDKNQSAPFNLGGSMMAPVGGGGGGTSDIIATIGKSLESVWQGVANFAKKL